MNTPSHTIVAFIPYPITSGLKHQIEWTILFPSNKKASDCWLLYCL